MDDEGWGWAWAWTWETNLKRESREIALSLHHSPPAQDMVSAHDFTPGKKAPLLTSPVSLGGIFVGSSSTFCFHLKLSYFLSSPSFLFLYIKPHLLLLIKTHVFFFFFVIFFFSHFFIAYAFFFPSSLLSL